MKILIQNPVEPILEGVAQTLVSIGETIIIWDGKIPINDLLDRYSPELTICYSNSIKEQIDSKLIFIGDYNGSLEPDLICISTTNTPSKPNDKHLYIETAANLAYHTIQYDEDYATDLFYYSHNTTPEILEYLLEIEKNYQLKIIGQHRIPLFSYLGVGTADDIVKFMKSCKIALTFDLPSLYTYAANKIFCVTNQDTDLFPHIDLLEEIAKYKIEIIDNYINNAYNYVVSDHTYFHRTHSILTRLGYNEQAKKCLIKLQEILEKTQ